MVNFFSKFVFFTGPREKKIELTETKVGEKYFISKCYFFTEFMLGLPVIKSAKSQRYFQNIQHKRLGQGASEIPC